MRANMPLRSPWRIIAAAGALTTAIIHLSQFTSAWHDSALIAAGFVVLAVVCIAGAVALAIHDTPMTWLLIAGICVIATSAYLVSRTSGLPGMASDIGDWANPAGIGAVTSQVLVIAATAVTAARYHAFPLNDKTRKRA